MPLNWDVSKVPDRLEKYPPGEDDMNVVTKTLILSTMVLGIGEITAKTAAEFYARIHLYEVLFGAFITAQDEETRDWVDRPITAQQVRDHIGLTTNVFPMETRAKWVTRIVTKGRLDELVREFEKEGESDGR